MQLTKSRVAIKTFKSIWYVYFDNKCYQKVSGGQMLAKRTPAHHVVLLSASEGIHQVTCNPGHLNLIYILLLIERLSSIL